MAALTSNTITADGTYSLSTIPGQLYVFSVAGTFGSGSLAIKWIDPAGNATAFSTSPATSATTFTLRAPSAQVDLVLSGSTNPSLTIGLTLAAPSAAPTSDDLATSLTGATSKATPIDADKLGFWDSVGSTLKQCTMTQFWTNYIKPLVDAGTSTLSNKRITPRVTTITSSATPTINTNTCDAVTITALATAITSMTTNLTGTPANFDQLLFRIKDDGSARAITWGASFIARGGILPATTVASKIWHVLFVWNSVASTWDCISSTLEV